jgi:hypothetical protein
LQFSLVVPPWVPMPSWVEMGGCAAVTGRVERGLRGCGSPPMRRPSAAARPCLMGVPIARDSLLAEAGLDLAIGRNATLGVSYVGQIANNVTDRAAQGGFSWKFDSLFAFHQRTLLAVKGRAQSPQSDQLPTGTDCGDRRSKSRDRAA